MIPRRPVASTHVLVSTSDRALCVVVSKVECQGARRSMLEDFGIGQRLEVSLRGSPFLSSLFNETPHRSVIRFYMGACEEKPSVIRLDS
jgi:hypothetical protein